MAKNNQAAKLTDRTTTNAVVMAINEQASRLQALITQIDPKRNIDYELGYPVKVSNTDYWKMFEREGYASRVVSIAPKGCWATPPRVFENEEQEETEFEQRYEELVKAVDLNSYLLRADILSGVSEYGILLLGFLDGLELQEPVAGLEDIPDEEAVQRRPGDLELGFLRVVDQRKVSIYKLVTDKTNRRYGLPEFYKVQLDDVTAVDTSSGLSTREVTVHWSRILHIADQCLTSELYGTPRMLAVFNYLYNIQKILGGSGEMFWQGAFPGISLETQSGMEDVELDDDAIKQAMFDYQNKLKRYLALQGMTANSLQVQVASPKDHLETQLDAICSTIECPKRIFLGSERGELASSQDTIAWNGRLSHRQHFYITPKIIRPLVDRLMLVGCLPPVEEYDVGWDDLNTTTDETRAKNGLVRTQALAQFVQSGLGSVMPFSTYLAKVLEFGTDEVETIMKEIKDLADELIEEEDEGTETPDGRNLDEDE